MDSSVKGAVASNIVTRANMGNSSKGVADLTVKTPYIPPPPRKIEKFFCWTCGYDVNHDGHGFPCQRLSKLQPHATRYNLRQFPNCGAWCAKNMN